MEHYDIGIVTKPQGLKGEFRAKIEPKFYSIINNAKQIIVKNETYKVEKVVDRGGFFVIKTEEISSVEGVEKLKNQIISVCLEEPDFVKNIGFVGYNVLVSGKNMGKVQEVNNYGASDILTIVNNKSEKMCAVVPGLIKSVDDENKVLELDENAYYEVVL